MYVCLFVCTDVNRCARLVLRPLRKWISCNSFAIWIQVRITTTYTIAFGKFSLLLVNFHSEGWLLHSLLASFRLDSLQSLQMPKVSPSSPSSPKSPVPPVPLSPPQLTSEDMPVKAVRAQAHRYTGIPVTQILEGPFSDVSKPIFALKLEKCFTKVARFCAVPRSTFRVF